MRDLTVSMQLNRGVSLCGPIMCPFYTIFLFLVSLCGCAPDFGGDTEYTSLTYRQYVRKVGVNWFDPRGASEINYRLYSTRDSYDSWWRLTIARTDFDNQLGQMDEDMEDPGYASYNSERVGPVRKTASNVPAVPTNWPAPCDTPPTWWKRPGNGQHLACTRWELQVDDTVYDGRSKGWYWLYDIQSETLWIWHWNHQHFGLGWNSSP
jgi:hypothetical protein